VAATRLVEAVGPFLEGLLPENWTAVRAILDVESTVEFTRMAAVGRMLTGLIDLLTVAFVYLLGRDLFGVGVGLLAALFAALNVMHIQLAHFFAVDPYLTFFTVVALWAMVAALRAGKGERSPRFFLAVAGAAIGLAIGSKFSAVMLLLPLAVTVWVLHENQGRRRFVLRYGPPVIIAAVVFVLTNPFAVIDWTCTVITPETQLGPVTIPRLNWGSCYLENVARQSAMVGGDEAFTFTRQYVDTTPYLYPIVMQLRWGMGYGLGIAAFAGLVWAAWRVASKGLRWQKRFRVPVPTSAMAGEVVLLAWTVPYFLVTGSFYVKFMRYLQPLTPFLVIYAAALLLGIVPRWRRNLALAVVGVMTVLYATSFVAIYGEPHPWLVASRWIFENVEPGAVIVAEHWDDPLPSSIDVAGVHRRSGEFVAAEVNWLSGIREADNVTKLEANLGVLAAADYVSIASNRGYGVIARLPDLYPLSSQYYPLLFSGQLGFEPVFVNARSPHIGTVHYWPARFSASGLTAPDLVEWYLSQPMILSPGPADESFTVYDQPMPMLFQNTGRLSADEMLALFTGAIDGAPAEGQ
jgi:4-amino-4-deoxy-L-arabinose transferase-like glycosyltransferase